MRCCTTNDTPGLSLLDKKYGLEEFSYGWIDGTEVLEVLSAISSNSDVKSRMSKCNQESHKTSKNYHFWTRIDQPTNQNSQTQKIKSQSWLIKGFERTTIQLQLPTEFNYKYHNQQDKP